jgi:HK97 family phage major capsid protein
MVVKTRSRKLSAIVAAKRGAHTPHSTRDTAGAALDLDANLDALTLPQLEQQRAALLARLGAPEAGDNLDTLVERADAVVTAIGRAQTRQADVESRRQALLNARVTVPANGQPGTSDNAGERGDEQRNDQPRTLGEAFTRSAEFQAMRASGATRMSRVEVAVPDAQRAFLGTDYPSVPTRVPGILTPNRDTPLTVLDLIDRQTISSNTVSWVQEVAAPSGATEVAQGELKPESTWEVELKEDSAATIAHWIDIARQAIEDESMLQGYINGRMVYGVEKRLNAQVLNGNGTAPNLRGILNTSGIGTYTGLGTDSYLVQLRKARTVAELSEYVPDGVVLHPSDWETVELDTNDNGSFRAIASVADGAVRRVWGLTVVSTPSIAQGTALVGAFREGATLWERTGINVYITDSDGDKFRRNILTMLAEKRAALSVWRPKAYVKVTLTAPTTPEE